MTTPPLDPVMPRPTSRDLASLREAFNLFDNHSRVLQTTFDTLRNELAKANQELSDKNMALSQKVDELQQLSSRLQCVLESLTDGVLVVGESLVVERCNPVAARLLNATRESIEGQAYPDVNRHLSNVDAIRAAIRDGQTLRDEPRRCPDARGGWSEVLASVAPIRSPSGAILGAIEVLRDVTEFHALTARLHHQERMAALGEMAASVAHEIRNPLGTIEGFARLLRRDLESQPDPRRLADKIVEGAQNLNYVITNLLTYVRPMSLQYEVFDVNKLMASVAEALVVSATTKHVTVTIPPIESAITLNADIRQLRQVLLNVGLNAIEACPSGGQVSLTAARLDRDMRFTIRDTGCGMDAETRERMFDPFFTTKQAGTGLGLSLCHKIVTGHSGRFEVVSELNQGTVIDIILPEYGGRAK